MKSDQIKFGRDIPLETIAQLVDHGEQAIFEYLTRKNAPAELIDLCSQVNILIHHENEKKAGKYSDVRAKEIIELLPDVTNNILALGGDPGW